MLQIIIIIFSILFSIGGVLGAFIPVLPGPFLSFIGLLLFYFTSYSEISLTWLILFGVAMAIVSIADNFIAPYFAKRAGGSRSASIGSFIGLIAGAVFFPPFGMFIGSFIGALIGEFLQTKKIDTPEFKIAWGAFLGVILSSGIKLAYSLWLCVIIIKELIY